MAEEDDPKEYRWETGYEKTWEVLQEDAEGLLESSVADIIQRNKRKRQAEKSGNIKLGMMRHLFILLDCSDSMTNQDLKPTRLLCTLKLLEGFVDEFFDQNPISQIGLIIMHNKRAEKISDLTGNARKHLSALSGLNRTSLIGEPSLQNGLELAMKSLKLLPSHASREILVIMGSLTTCDPTDINITIDTLKTEGVRCSVIGLAAEVHVCRVLCKETGGLYGVILDDSHFKDQLYQHVDPPLAATVLEASLIKMGFPHHLAAQGEDKKEPLTMCMCHVDADDDSCKLSTGGFYCPQCYSKYCELPVECKVCNLTLVSAPHLARSYHHLFPAPNYKELPYAKQTDSCYACQDLFGDATKSVYQCEVCRLVFCVDCDIFVHETLHTCPGCASTINENKSTDLEQADLSASVSSAPSTSACVY